jgi:hypothetical protein
LKLLRQDFERYKLAIDVQLENLNTLNQLLIARLEKLEKDAKLHPLKKVFGVKAK